MSSPARGAHRAGTPFDVLASPAQWRLIGSALPIEARPERQAAYSRWAESHLERHAHREILFCLEGETYEHFNGQDYRCRPGSVFLFDAYEAHAVNYPRDGRAFTHLWIMILATDVTASVYGQRAGASGELQRTPMVLAQAERDWLIRCWQQVRQPPDWMSPALSRAALLAAVAALVFRAVDSWRSAPLDGDGARRRREIVAAVRRHIASHLAEANDLETLARLSGYSKFHFTRLFKACTGQTVHAYVDDCRRMRAATLLGEGLSCKAIAGQLGFASAAAFSNWRRQRRV